MAFVPSLPGFAGARGVREVKPPIPDEQRLIARAAAGETAAFRQLYERSRADVARLVYRMLGARADLEDVIQEVFIQAYKSLKDFRGQSKFSTWLHRVTVNVVLMHRRSARSRPVFADEPPGDPSLRSDDLAPDEDAERRERVRAFGRLLGRLADKKRLVFVLHELEGLPPSEIATIVGAPVLTVRTRLFYARRELEAMLAEEPALAGLQIAFSKGSASEAPREVPVAPASEPAPASAEVPSPLAIVNVDEVGAMAATAEAEDAEAEEEEMVSGASLDPGSDA